MLRRRGYGRTALSEVESGNAKDVRPDGDEKRWRFDDDLGRLKERPRESIRSQNQTNMFLLHRLSRFPSKEHVLLFPHFQKYTEERAGFPNAHDCTVFLFCFDCTAQQKPPQSHSVCCAKDSKKNSRE